MLEITTMYPEFVANQVLTNTQLNQLRDFLDGQDRLTRTKFVGIGIVCGLEMRIVRPGGSSRNVELTEGLGVTSDGYVVCTPQTSYTHVRPYVDPDMLEDTITPSYGPWRRPSGTNQLDLLELVAVAGGDPVPPGATLLRSAALASRVVVAYLEREPVDLKSCFVTECDNDGMNIRWNLRLLLVPRARLTAVLPCPAPPEPLSVRRLHTQLPLRNAKATGEIDAAYAAIVRPALAPLIQAIRTAFDAHGARLGLASDIGQQIEDAIDNKVGNVPANRINQYHYDWLKDTTYALNEAVTAACRLPGECSPDGDFPRHLMLGADGVEGFRHGFSPASVRHHDHEDLARVKGLFRRLHAMSTRLDFGGVGEVRLTPSRVEGEPLGRRAVPHYYHFQTPESRATWQPKLCCTSERLWAYDTPRDDIDTDDYMRSTFLRVEGHLGEEIGAAMEDITGERRTHNAEFCVVRTNFDDPGVALTTLENTIKDLLDHRAALSSKQRITTAKTMQGASFVVDDFRGLADEVRELEVNLLKVSTEWASLRRSRKLHCDTGSLAALYHDTRAELTCVFSGLNAELSKLTENVDKLENSLSPVDESLGHRGGLVGWQASFQQQQIRGFVEAWLPRKLVDFNYRLFIHRYKDLLQGLNDSWLLWGVHGLPVTGAKLPFPVSDPWPAGAAAISHALLSFTRGCFHTRMAQLYLAYAEVWRNDYSYFPNLAKHVDGLEHLAGVEKCGTLVLVSDRNGVVRSDFSLACCLPCCCDVALDDTCLPTVALPEHRVEILEESGGHFKPVDTRIDLRHSGFDPNLDRTRGEVLSPPIKVKLTHELSELGAKVKLVEEGIIRYVFEEPTPGLIDSVEFVVESQGDCKGSDVSRVSILLEPPPIKKEVPPEPEPEPEPEPDPTCAIGGTVRVDGKLIPGVGVFILGPETASTKADANGRYKFTNIRCGRYQIGIESHFPMRVVNVQDSVVVDLVIEREERPVDVAIRVFEPSGKPLPGASVALKGPDGAVIGQPPDQGIHVFRNVPRGDYVATATSERFTRGSARVHVTGAEDVSATIVLTRISFAIPDGFVHRTAAASGVVTTTARDRVTELYGDRYNDWFTKVEKAASPELRGVVAYKRAADFMTEVLPSAETPIEVVVANFIGVRDSLARKASATSDAAERKALTTILSNVSLAFMDRVTIDSPEKVPPAVEASFEKTADVLERLNVDRVRLMRDWDGEKLANVAKSETPGVLSQLMRG